MSIKIVYLPRFFIKTSINPLIAKIMTKRLLNLNKSTRIITILLTTLLFLPSIARAEETITYDLTIGGIEVTSDNATDVLGDGKVSFDPDANIPEPERTPSSL